MIHRDTLRNGLYIAIAAVVLALTAIFGKFQELTVIANLSLSYVLLVAVLVVIGYVAGSSVRERGAVEAALNGAVSSLIVGTALVLLIILESAVDLTFIFPDLKTDPIGPVLTFGLELLPGCILLLVLSAVGGAVGALLHRIPEKIRRVVVLSVTLTMIIGLLKSQITNVMTLPDALSIALVFGLAYVVGLRLSSSSMWMRLGAGAVIGLVIGLVLGLLANGANLEPGGLLRGTGSMPIILGTSPGNAVIPLMIIFGLIGAVGALVTNAASSISSGALYLVGMLLIFGVLNSQGTMSYIAAIVIFALLLILFWFTPSVNNQAEVRYGTLPRSSQQATRQLGLVAGLIVMLAAPAFLGQYITSVLDLVGLYIIMGIGLNVVVGYAGLLDLGYVAFFALGAYTVGILTTPSLLTCGGVAPSDIPFNELAATCTGVMTFWEAWPFAVLVSALAGILLGIPVLRLRGDYLAIVTLGFGEIIRLIALSNLFKPLMGAAQGIPNIPGPVIDLTFLNPTWRLELGTALNIYYLILAVVIVVAFISIRLAGSRLGRAWRSMRTDEDVAQAMGINLTRTKLLAFAIGAAFAGMGGAIFGSWLKGIFPNSFTLAVSINVLSLIIIGGLGSVPGVVVGALVLIGLPEVLRELQDYRLLAFGILLVVTMLLRPEGLIPPPVRRLAEKVDEYRTAKEASHG